MKYAFSILALIFVLLAIVNNLSTRDVVVGGMNVLSPSPYDALLAKPADERIAIPIRGVKKFQIADTWQAPRGSARKHQGQDIFAKKGTPVYSATDGFVVRVGESRLGGNTVFVMGAGGRVYYYAHLDSFRPGLAHGEQVSRDSVIGYVGSTGNAKGTPPHLHFGVYTLGGAINPITLF